MRLNLKHINLAYLDKPVFITEDGSIYVSSHGLHIEFTNTWYSNTKADIRLVP